MAFKYTLVKDRIRINLNLYKIYMYLLWAAKCDIHVHVIHACVLHGADDLEQLLKSCDIHTIV